MMRLFKQETGYTLGQYITQKRLLLARELILSGVPSTQVCFDCGFRDYSTFSRSYKKLFQNPPGRPLRFRKLLLPGISFYFFVNLYGHKCLHKDPVLPVFFGMQFAVFPDQLDLCGFLVRIQIFDVNLLLPEHGLNGCQQLVQAVSALCRDPYV